MPLQADDTPLSVDVLEQAEVGAGAPVVAGCAPRGRCCRRHGRGQGRESEPRCHGQTGGHRPKLRYGHGLSFSRCAAGGGGRRRVNWPRARSDAVEPRSEPDSRSVPTSDRSLAHLDVEGRRDGIEGGSEARLHAVSGMERVECGSRILGEPDAGGPPLKAGLKGEGGLVAARTRVRRIPGRATAPGKAGSAHRSTATGCP